MFIIDNLGSESLLQKSHPDIHSLSKQHIAPFNIENDRHH